MNKVFPYPTDEERARAISRVAIRVAASADTPHLDPGLALEELGRHFEDLLDTSGARVVDRGADYTLKAELIRYRYDVSFKAPVNWLFKSDQEMAMKPGRCTHRVEAELLVSVLEGEPRSVVETYTLSRSVEGETHALDPECPFDESRREDLLVQALQESLPCIRIPLVNFFAPRGFVAEHRRTRDGKGDLFSASLSQSSLPADAGAVGIYRVQRSTNARGERVRSERRIADGKITSGASEEATWFEVDLSKAIDAPLEGDVVRPVVDEGGVSGLNPWSTCNSALAEI